MTPRLWARLWARWLAPEGPLSLAALRVIVPLVAIAAPGFEAGARVARLPRASFVVPEGLGWFVRVVPIDARLATAAQVVAFGAALSATLGLFARGALAALLVALFYLYSIAQLTGFVWHDMHILWMIALLAVSPCGDAFGADAGFRTTRAPSLSYAKSLWAARALLACVYAFPGIWKLREQGLAWALSDNLKHQLWFKWAEHGAVPSLRVDRIPGALEAGGLAVLVFEVGFPVFVLSRRARPLLALAGVLFHLSAHVVFGIPFWGLVACYVVLVDVDRLARRLGAALVTRPPALAPRGARAVASVVISALVVGAVVQGVRGRTQSYPFACYPTFQWDPGVWMPDLVIEGVTADGREIAIDHARDAWGRRSQRDWATVWSVAGVTGPTSPERLRAHYAIFARAPDVPLVKVRFYRVLVSVDPASAGRVAERELVGELDP